MGIMEQRQEEQELLASAKSRRHEQGMQDLRRLLEFRLRKQDQRLRQCLPADFAAEQARAQVYETLLNEI